jgi:hypothetical protein
MKAPDFASVRELVKQHQAFYEVLPYSIVIEERLPASAAAVRRSQAGFDIDVYAITAASVPGGSPEYALGYAALRDIAETVASQSYDSCSIEAIPFTSTIILDAKRKFQPEAMLRIRVTHFRGLDQSSGKEEENALKAILKQLQHLGVSFGRSRA